MSFTTRTKIMEDHKLLLIFIHGFKGDENTFMNFPDRLQSVLTDSIRNVDVKSLIYNELETRGDLRKAVENFYLWMKREREEEISKLNGKGNVWVCLLGHSMGGILAADVITKYATSSSYIIGLIAFDTPFYGVHDDVFSKAALDRAGKITQDISGTFSLIKAAAAAGAAGAVSVPPKTSKSSGWGKLGLAAGVASVAALGAGAAYYHREKVGKGVKWLGGHLEFVSVLWNIDELEERVENLMKVPNIVFRCYYTQIPPEKNSFSSPKTFIRLPPSHMMSYFSAIACTSKDEIEAHTCMFDPNKNDYYYDLGHVTQKYLIEMVENHVNCQAKKSVSLF